MHRHACHALFHLKTVIRLLFGLRAQLVKGEFGKRPAADAFFEMGDGASRHNEFRCDARPLFLRPVAALLGDCGLLFFGRNNTLSFDRNRRIERQCT